MEFAELDMTEQLTLGCPLSSLEADAYRVSLQLVETPASPPLLGHLSLPLLVDLASGWLTGSEDTCTQPPLRRYSVFLTPYCRYFSALVLSCILSHSSVRPEELLDPEASPWNQEAHPGKLNVMASFTPLLTSTGHEAVII